jgi:Heterokaryon incompatibility protein (HET)
MARIRLLKVRPAKEGLNSPMELDLAVFEVETAPPYFALSYTWDAPWDGLASEWDDPNHGCMITVNDLRWGVRMNLAHALYRLRFSLLPMLTGLGEVDKNTDNVWLWIDAICINQDDPNDKAEFIGRMRDIYHRAQATLVWLGPTHEYTDFLLERFEVVQAAVRGELPALPNIQDPGSGEELSSTSDPLSEKETAYLKRLKADIFSKNAEKEWDAVIWMFKNNWWRRIWVVQEVVVAQKVYLIQGHICIAFWLLYELHQSILQHLKYFLGLEIFKGSNADGLMHVVHDASSKFLEILHLMTQSDGDRLPQFNLLETLNSLRSRSCSDDRDKIYACLGMTKQSDIVTPDYRRSVEDVYGSLTRKVIEDRKDLAVLEYCVCSIHMDGDVPSWVPDWRVSGRWSKKSLYENSLADSVGRPDGNTITRKYNAGGSEPLHATFSDDSKVLKLQVALVDEVDFVGRSLWKEDPSIEQARAQNRKQRDEIWNKYQIKASDLAAEHAACT